MKQLQLYLTIVTPKGTITVVNTKNLPTVSKFIDRIALFNYLISQKEIIDSGGDFIPMTVELSREDYVSCLKEIARKQKLFSKFSDALLISDGKLTLIVLKHV